MTDAFAPLPEKVIDEGLREGYRTVCPACSATFALKPSLFMRSGMANSGARHCPTCGVFLVTRINDANDAMDAEVIQSDGE